VKLATHRSGEELMDTLRRRMVASGIALIGSLLLWCRPGYAQIDGADSTKKSGKGPTVKVSGYVQFFYRARFDVNHDGIVDPDAFRVQRVRIAFKGRITDHVAYDVEIDPRAPEITGILRDAFISLDYIPNHKVRLGQQKTQFGYENRESSSRLFVVNRSEVSDNLSRGVTLRDLGIGIIGRWPLQGGFAIEDAITLVNGSGMNVQADSTKRKNLWGRIGGRYKRDRLTARLGLSYASGDQQEPEDPGPPVVDGFTFDFKRWGTDVEIDHPLVFLAAEYVKGEDSAPASADASGTRSGYYVLLAGKTKWRLGPLIRYDQLEEYQRWTYGAFYGLPADDVRLLFNYEVWQDDLGRHDDKLYLWMQIRF
jgi:hypothetical protein